MTPDWTELHPTYPPDLRWQRQYGLNGKAATRADILDWCVRNGWKVVGYRFPKPQEFLINPWPSPIWGHYHWKEDTPGTVKYLIIERLPGAPPLGRE